MNYFAIIIIHRYENITSSNIYNAVNNNKRQKHIKRFCRSAY